MMLPVDHSLQYEDIPVVASVEEKITFPGGINKPKLVTLCDSHGSKRKQLVKGGNDDLRQDAVMQQFFRMLNAFLLEAQSTASRMLSIRTYNALPFSPASGLLEWVDNTEPFQSFVINGNKFVISSYKVFITKVFIHDDVMDIFIISRRFINFSDCGKSTRPKK